MGGLGWTGFTFPFSKGKWKWTKKGGNLLFHHCFFFGWLVVWEPQVEDPLHQHLGVAVKVQRVLVVDDWVVRVRIQEHGHVTSSSTHLGEGAWKCVWNTQPCSHNASTTSTGSKNGSWNATGVDLLAVSSSQQHDFKVEVTSYPLNRMAQRLTSHTLWSVFIKLSFHLSSGVFSQLTHCEYGSMFTLHPGQELGSIFSKFKCVSQPWDQSFVQRRLLLGPQEEKVEAQMK